MSLFLSKEIIMLNIKDENVILYNYFTHKIIKTNIEVNNYLKYLKQKYNNSAINEEDPKIVKFINSKALHTLEKNTFFYRDKEQYKMLDFADAIKSLDYNVKINEVYFHVTQRCNFNCTYCYNRDNLQSLNDLNFKEVCDIIDKLKAISVRAIVLTGGEPLLRKDIVDIAKYIHLKGIACVLLTNGSLLHDNYEILNYVDTVIISLDDINTNKNSKQRLNSDKFDIINNLENIPVQFKNKVVVRSVITKGQEDFVQINKEYITKNLGLNYTNVPFLPNCKDDVKNIPDYLKLIDYDEAKPFKQTRCGACLRELAINANGDMYPCQTFIKPEFKIGNITEEEWLDNIRSSSVTNCFMNLTILDVKGCNECNFKYLCGGGCRALSYNVYNNLNSKLEFMCQYLKEIALARVNKIEFQEVDL